jgi:hypothetical protein
VDGFRRAAFVEFDSFVKTRIASRKGAKHAKKTHGIWLSDLAFLASLREKRVFAARSSFVEFRGDFRLG